MIEFAFKNQRFQKFFSGFGFNTNGPKGAILLALLLISICWLPLAVYTIAHGTFWTGNIRTSFITHFDTQARLLVTLPLLIICEIKVSEQLGKILTQFSESEIIEKKEQHLFESTVGRNVRFLKSHWVDMGLLLICYLQVYMVMRYETEFTSLFTWQTMEENGTLTFNFGGWWNAFVSRPLVVFVLYRWALRVMVWGNILRQTSKLRLKLYSIHPDQLGGLGFLGFSLRFFSPVAFGISAVIAGHIADYMLLANMHLADVKFIFAGYFVIITLLFTLPLMAFSSPLTKAREEAIFTFYGLGSGMNRELGRRIAANGYKVTPEDLDTQHYSTVCDFNSLMVNAVQMKSLPFNLKDLVPFWIATIIPFVPVILIEIPVAEVLKTLSGLLL